MDKELHRFIGSKIFYEVMSNLRYFKMFEEYENGVLKETFFKRLNITSYNNAYYRVKEELLHRGLIWENGLVVDLTKKGEKFLDALDQLERIANEDI